MRSFDIIDTQQWVARYREYIHCEVIANQREDDIIFEKRFMSVMISVSRYVTMLDVDVEGIFIISLVFFVEPDIRFSSSLRLTQEMIWNTPEKRGIAVLAIECTCAFWAMAPKGTMSCRTWERIFVLKFIHLSCFSKPTTPRPSRSLKWAVTKCMNKNSPVFYKNLFPCYVLIPCFGAGQGYRWPILSLDHL